MDNRVTFFGTAGLGTTLALVLGIWHAPAPINVIASRAAESAGAPSARLACPKNAPDAPASNAAALLGAFFGTHFVSSQRAGRFARRRGWSLDAMIAMVPDPIDSHLDWGFDFDLEAIRRAYERAGYVLDRFWLPWSEAGDTLARAGCAPGTALWQTHPGIVLLRSDRKLHVLFLVGEIPTSGIQKRALSRALSERRQLFDADALVPSAPATEGRRVVRIVGPLFSGSSLSLRISLDAYLARHVADSVHIISGSATAPANLEQLSGRRMTFGATVNSDTTLKRVLKSDVIQRLHLRESQVALLREGTTVYGAKAADSSHGPARIESFLDIPFPMNISTLRTEYQRHPELAQPFQPMPGSGGTPRLPVDLQEPSGFTETPPVTSHLTPSALDLQLDRVAGLIRENDIHAVVLLGTDIRDKLFLAEEVRKRVRDVQIITYVSNVLLANPDDERWLRGMIVISTYPLIAQNQAWAVASNADDRRRILLPTDAAEGTYNATLAQLRLEELALDYATPLPVSGSDTLSRPPVWITVVGRRAILPLTVAESPSQASSAGSYLIALRRLPGGGAGTQGPRQQTIAAGALILVVSLVAGLAVLVLAYYVLVRRRIGRAPKAKALTSGADEVEARSTDTRAAAGGQRSSRPWNIPPLRFQERLYFAVTVIALIGIIAPTATLLIRAARADILATGWLMAVVLALVVFTVAATRILPSAYEQRRRRGEQVKLTEPASKGRKLTERILATIVILTAVAYVTLILLFSLDILALDQRDAIFFFQRATAIDSGASPLVPTILTGAAFTLWCLWHHQRIRLLNRSTGFEVAAIDLATRKQDESAHQQAPRALAFRRIRETDLDHEHSAFLRASRAVVRVRAHLSKLMPDRWGGGLFAVLLLTAFALAWQFDRTLESIAFPASRLGPTHFDLLFRLGIVGVLMATAWSLYRFYRVWRAFDDCLEAVTLMPLISAFDRLPQRLSRVSRLTLFDSPTSASADSMAKMQEQHLRRLLATCAPEIQNLSGSHRDLVTEVSKLLLEPRSADAAGRLSHGFGELYEVLRAFWRIEPTAQEVELVVKDVSRMDAPNEAVTASTTGKFRRTFVGPLGLWVRAAEEFAASQVVEYIDWVLHHLRRLALFILLSLLVMATLLSSYPFQPQSTVNTIFLALVVAAVVTLLSTMVGLNRDELLSRITKTTPGQITWDAHFVLNLALFGAVPLLALASSEFPQVRGILFGWIEPLLRALSHG
jgi:hypothetical protein